MALELTKVISTDAAVYTLCMSSLNVVAFARLMQSMWNGQDFVSPTDFKSEVSRFARRFGGYKWVLNAQLQTIPIASTNLWLVLLRIPSSRPSPRTFPQFVRVQVLGFLAAENDGFET